ncbi:hypothetical protein Q4I28_004049 [Leishmania naiffi]|uniref:Uncharacterized protein n=1 Tax=Leishmania naiffi TaxID=5678 RepID=A0AAW3BS46_9TRYP
MPHQLNATPRHAGPPQSHRSAGRLAAATVMQAPTRRIPRGGAGSPPAGSEGRVRRARTTPTPCLAHGRHKRVHCRGSPRRNAAQDMATGISSDEAL